MKDLISKADVLETYAELYDTFEDNQFIRKELNKVYDKLNGLPYAQPEPCEDAVSRADVFDMLDMYPFTEYGEYETAREIVKRLPSVEPKPDQYEDALKKIKNASFVGSDGLDYVETLQALDALKDAICVTLHVTKISKHCSDFSDLDEVIECEDAVSREAVSSWLKQYGQDVLHGKYKFSLMYIWKSLMDLPSAQPEIIHCRDCKHHWTHSSMDVFPIEICDLDQTFYDSNIDYCSLAERRTDELGDK